MKTVESVLREEKKQLEKIIEEAKKRLRLAPAGHLRVRAWKGVVEYYYNKTDSSSDAGRLNSTSSNGRYLKKCEVILARNIAQRDYDTQVVKMAEERTKVISAFLKKYKKTNLKNIYQRMNIHRRKLLDVCVLSDEEYVKQWQNMKYEGKVFSDEVPEIITERGESVRSKSEKIIADKLYSLNIPYRYEYPLVLDGNVKVYPDFTILKMPEREEVYLEHLGMMDDTKYVENTMYKLNNYEKNGIYLGINLFITHETQKNPLNIRVLDSLIRKIFVT